MSNKDKILISVMLGLLLILCVKSVWLDNYTPENDAEAIFYEEMTDLKNERYTSWIYDYHIVTTKIVSISKMSEKERTVKDAEGNEMIATGQYKAKIRKYIFGILPFSENRILDIDLD